MTNKTYTIFCIRKANRNAYVHGYVVNAQNVKEAKSKAAGLLNDKFGAHAFSLTNGKLPTGWAWRYISEQHNVTTDEIMQRAYSPNGFAIYD